MDIQILRELGSKLGRYLKRFAKCIKTKPSRDHLHTYVSGQLGPLERKSVEPIALEAGVPPRSLQEFLALHKWDEEAVSVRHRDIVRRDYGRPNAVGVIDETSFAKKGKETVGVHRQYCGSRGKIDNCVVTVHLGYVTSEISTLLDGDLFLPEAWIDDTARRKKAAVPKDLEFRTKIDIAIELIKRSRDEEIPMKWITADELYGRSGKFRDAVAEADLRYVVEVPNNMHGWTTRPKVQAAGTKTAAGKTLKKSRLFPGQKKARSIEKIGRKLRRPWTRFRIKDTEKGPQIWKAREVDLFPKNEEIPGNKIRLIIAINEVDKEVKYFFSNAPDEYELGDLLCVAFCRWNIERLFQDAKGEVGFDHFEVRKYIALKRHLIVTMLSLYFLAKETSRLRKKKSVVVPGSGEDGYRSATRSGHEPRGTNAAIGESRTQDRLSSTEPRTRGSLTRQEAATEAA